MLEIPIDDAAASRTLYDEFLNSRALPNPLHGYIGALYGIALEIWKPTDTYIPCNYFFQETMYALPLQAIVDAR